MIFDFAESLGVDLWSLDLIDGKIIIVVVVV